MAPSVDARILALYGEPLPRHGGVVHVAAVCSPAPDQYAVLKIGPHSPRSAADAFALSLSRARADVVLSTGAILRAEPTLRVEPFGAEADGLLELRRRVFLREEPPWLVVLTRGDLDLAHPALHTWVRPVVVTGPTGAARLRPQIEAGAPVELVELPDPSPAAAIAWARQVLRARTITVEAGPTSALPLYEAPGAVDELMLSVFEGPVPAAGQGKPFLGPAAIRATFGACRAQTVVDEASGRWRLQRFVRPSPG